MDEIKKQIVGRLKQANNILVTVRNSPTVDLLSACIGLSLVLDKMDKHAAAVFSGEIPNAIEFLKPEATIEQTPDSLRDFIIALDKSKADKLRYKVEDKVVRIFITPYKTSLSQDDLEFSQGDFNVDAVVALGAHEQQELDQAITVHGRILHDATIISINNTPNGNLGAMNWQEISASSISEMVTELVKDLHKEALDEQISTALLTGIVAETERFSNDKTTPKTMSLAGELMAAGANQQLVASSLQAAAQRLEEEPQSIPTDARASMSSQPAPIPTATVSDDGTLEIDHQESEQDLQPAAEALKEPPTPQKEEAVPAPESVFPKIVTPTREMLPTPGPAQRTNDYDSPLSETPFTAEYEETPMPVRSYLVDQPTIPSATPASKTPPIEPSKTNPLEVPPAELPAPILHHEVLSNTPAATSVALPQTAWTPPQVIPPSTPTSTPLPTPIVIEQPVIPSTPPITVSPTPAEEHETTPLGQTLSEIEQSVHSPHLTTPTPPEAAAQGSDISAARDQVMDALRSDAPRLEPLKSLNANPLGDELHPHTEGIAPTPTTGIEVDAEGNIQAALSQGGMPYADAHSATAPDPGALATPPSLPAAPELHATDMAPPPVPPPMTPPAY